MDEAIIRQIKDPIRRGDSYMEIGNYSLAVESYMEALMMDTGNVSINMKLGEAYIKLGNYKEAKQTFEEVIRISPQSTLALNYLKKLDPDGMVHVGDGHLNRKEYKEALKHYEQSLQLEPDHVGALYGKARILEELGDNEKALKLFEKITDIDSLYKSDFKHILNHVAINLKKAGRLDRSVALYQKAITIDPKDEALYFNLSVVYYKQQNMDMAIKELNKALEIEPGFEEAKTLLEQFRNTVEEKRTEDR